MKKRIAIVAIAALASQLHAGDLGDMVSRIAADLNIKVVKLDDRHTIHHRVDHRRDVRKRVVHHKRHNVHKKRKRVNRTKACKLNFHTLKEYKRIVRTRHPKHHKRFAKHHSRKSHIKHAKHVSNKKLGHYAGNGWYGDDDGYYNEEWEDVDYVPTEWERRRHKQRGYRHYRRQWYLTYLYEGSSFYDSYGFCYGEFDRYGFEFEGKFYGYDYNYTYQDRLHGKGIFEHRYYRPITHRYATQNDWDLDPYWADSDRFAFKINFR